MDEPQPPPRKALIDRYRDLLAELGAREVADKLAKIEGCLWYGRPGSAPLFAEELREIRERGDRLREANGQEPPALLLLCVGYSPEPLLLAAVHHRPVEVLLLQEQGLQHDYVASLTKLWNRYLPPDLPEFESLPKRTVRDDPADLFLTVRDVLQRRRQGGGRIVLDVTGAKKSMVAGGFLAAGFLEIETSYVDFAAYDPVLRRPIPGTSLPGRLEHPYSLFKLREEARLEEELDRGNFREAERLAGTLSEMARSPQVAGLLPAGEAGAWSARFERVEQIARAYRSWSEGFYAESAEQLTRVAAGVPIPATVERLREVWPRSKESPREIIAALQNAKVFADPATALAYFLDVLVWVTEDRIAERPRDLYLRLYGTLESIIYYAFHAFVTRHPERLQIEPALPEQADEVRGVVIESCERNSTDALKILRGKRWKKQPPEDSAAGPARETWSGEAWLAGPALPPAVAEVLVGKKGEIRLWSFSDLRHKAVHWLAPVPVSWAEKLLQYYRTVLKALIPAVTSRLREDGLDTEVRERLDEWEARLLAAAEGRIADDCKPLPYREVTAHVTARLSGGGTSAEVRDADLRGR
ncbi:MAG TPA: hypothetical protein VFR03_12500 [Thermoanaerobaculia bacterium]|nr:hypothetical protein [Thermoanaerobaculia bacterium]